MNKLQDAYQQACDLLDDYGMPNVISSRTSREDKDMEVCLLYRDMTYKFSYDKKEMKMIHERIVSITYLKDNKKINALTTRQLICLTCLWLVRIAFTDTLLERDCRVRQLTKMCCPSKTRELTEIGKKMTGYELIIKGVKQLQNLKQRYDCAEPGKLVSVIEEIETKLKEKKELTEEFDKYHKRLSIQVRMCETVEAGPELQKEIVKSKIKLLSLSRRLRIITDLEKHLEMIKKYSSTNTDEIFRITRKLKRLEEITVYKVLTEGFKKFMPFVTKTKVLPSSVLRVENHGTHE